MRRIIAAGGAGKVMRDGRQFFFDRRDERTKQEAPSKLHFPYQRRKKLAAT